MGSLSIRFCVWLFLLALTVRISLIFALGSYRSAEGSEVINIARTLAERGEFADAYGPGSGPTAHTSPVYPFLLSLVFRVLGTGRAGEIGQEIFSSAAASLSCALLPSVAFAFGLGMRVGRWAGLWAALLPINFYPQTKGSFEGAFTGLSLVLICLYFARIWESGRFSSLQAIVGGVCAGVALLVSPTVVPVLFLSLVIGAWLFRDRLLIYFRFTCLFTALAVLVLVPWALRNWRVLGSPIFGRSNLGLELMISNNDLASANYLDNDAHGLFNRYHPFLNLAARAALMSRGEVAFHRERMKEATAWIVSHPARFAQLTVARFGLFWFPRMKRSAQTIFIRLEALLGVIGYILLLRTKSLSKWLVAALWLGYPPIYYFVQAYTRYRYPIEWSFVILGSFAVWTLLSQRSGTRVRFNE